ncbi:lipase family protein [Cohnella suwonensis]|uniref:Lipase family protein n=1 Tax=Cohnella suwonensis TaxID=696072 RepID=A0ABW0LVQ1_9BACL
MGGYDNRTAIFLASVCSQTYASYNNPDGSFVVPEGFRLAKEIRAKSLAGVSERFGFIIESDSHVVVAFRGTSSAQDWVADAMASQVKVKWASRAGYAHRGFSRIYDSARGQVLETLEGLPPGKALNITGHSLGGGLATLCALDAAENSSFENPTTYTFGSPRVGNPAFARAFKERAGDNYRVNNRFDVVTHLPPQIYRLPKRDKTFYYEHVSKPETLAFHNGSVSGNHVIGSYYAVLAERNPGFAESLSERNPGLCPGTADSEGAFPA